MKQFQEVRLGDIKPNPFRNFEVDPIDDDLVETHRQSIQQTGFWNTVMLRKVADEYQLIFGHHRLQAAIQELGNNYMHGFMVHHDLPDYRIIQMLANENGPGRRSVGHLRASVMAARDHLNELLRKYPTWEEVTRVAQLGSTVLIEWFGNETSGPGHYATCVKHGVGRNVIEKFLGGDFSKGKTVEKCLDLLANDAGKPFDVRAGDMFPNLHQAATFRASVLSFPRLIPLADQLPLAESIVSKLHVIDTRAYPHLAGSPTAKSKEDRLTAPAVRDEVSRYARELLEVKACKETQADIIHTISRELEQWWKKQDHLTGLAEVLARNISSSPGLKLSEGCEEALKKITKARNALDKLEAALSGSGSASGVLRLIKGK